MVPHRLLILVTDASRDKQRFLITTVNFDAVIKLFIIKHFGAYLPKVD